MCITHSKMQRNIALTIEIGRHNNVIHGTYSHVFLVFPEVLAPPVLSPWPRPFLNNFNSKFPPATTVSATHTSQVGCNSTGDLCIRWGYFMVRYIVDVCFWCVHLHYMYTLYIYTIHLHYTSTLYVYTIHLHYMYTLYIYTIHLHYTSTLYVYTIHLHYMYTLYIYTICIHYTSTLYIYTICIHFTSTLYVYTIHLHYTSTLYIYTIHLHYTSTLYVYYICIYSWSGSIEKTTGHSLRYHNTGGLDLEVSVFFGHWRQQFICQLKQLIYSRYPLAN